MLYSPARWPAAGQEFRHQPGAHIISATTPLETANGAARQDTLILKGAALASRLRAEIRESLAELVARGGSPPRLVTLLAGAHPSALAYRGSIDRTMARVVSPIRQLISRRLFPQTPSSGSYGASAATPA
ncbi:MAG: hypothetical protein KatS3mg059_0163 [Thermomicrobiales bacterium]|nr:MAG: hypothetical protein KatS3mg059_0163 [Thermomicrobiales bacterium]